MADVIVAVVTNPLGALGGDGAGDEADEIEKVAKIDANAAASFFGREQRAIGRWFSNADGAPSWR